MRPTRPAQKGKHGPVALPGGRKASASGSMAKVLFRRSGPDALSLARRRIAELERKVGQQALEDPRIFSGKPNPALGELPRSERSLCAGARLRPRPGQQSRRPGGSTPHGTDVRSDGAEPIELRSPPLAGIEAEPSEETALRDKLQRLAIDNKHYGYRRIGALLRREGWSVNHKRVLRLMREDNLLCLRRRSFAPATTDSKHSYRIRSSWTLPNSVSKARRLEATTSNPSRILSNARRLWVADITYVRLLEDFGELLIVARCAQPTRHRAEALAHLTPSAGKSRRPLDMPPLKTRG